MAFETLNPCRSLLSVLVPILLPIFVSKTAAMASPYIAASQAPVGLRAVHICRAVEVGGRCISLMWAVV